MERVGLDPAFAKRYPAQLSGGQQQRVGVARALAADPPVMLMDEPFSAVDPVVRDQLQDEFLRLQGELGKTIVFVTHDIDEAIKLGDQVAVLRVGGKLAQLATPRRAALAPGRRLRRRLRRSRPRLPGARLRRGSARCRPTTSRPSSWATRSAGRATTAWSWWSTTIASRRAGCGWSPEPALAARSPRTTCLRGGTLATQGGTLRAALDACLSSPSGRGVVVDEAGRLIGSVTAREVLDLIEAQSRQKASRQRLDVPAARQRRARPRLHFWGYFMDNTQQRSSAGSGTTPGSRSCPSWSGCCSRCRSAGSRVATAGSTRR